jgi:hypothetical protein
VPPTHRFPRPAPIHRYFIISLLYSQRALRRRTFGMGFWERRSKAIRKLEGIHPEDPGNRHSTAIVREAAALAPVPVHHGS